MWHQGQIDRSTIRFAPHVKKREMLPRQISFATLMSVCSAVMFILCFGGLGLVGYEYTCGVYIFIYLRT